MLGNGNLLVETTSSASTVLKELDSNAVLVSTSIMPFVINSMTVNATGELYGINAGQLHKFSSQFSYAASTASTIPAGCMVSAFYIAKDTVYAIGNSPANPRYYMFTGSLGFLYQSMSNLQGIIPTGISVNNKNDVKIITWGSSDGNGSSHFFSGFFSTPKTGNLLATRDIGVLMVPALQHTLFTYNYYGAPIKTFQSFLQAQVIVKNYGIDTVKSFKLNYFAYKGGITSCYEGLHELFNATIPPGGTVSVQTGTFLSQYVNSNNFDANGTFNLNVCIYTSVPDNKNDINMSNNSVCEQSIMYTTGVEERVTNSGVRIFPNPSNGQFTILSDEVVVRIKLFDVSGREIRKEFPANHNFNFDASDLGCGFYFLHIDTDNDAFTRKIVIEK
jgi:hypothetical protein